MVSRSSTKPRKITLPNNFIPRWYQQDAWAALDAGIIKRAFHVWHRRAGKDVSYLNYTAKRAHTEIGGYYHLLPTQQQARKVIWNSINKDGVRLIDQAFPKELRKRTVEDQMLIEFHCGSMWQCVGSDNYDSLVGSNPRGLIFSEWSISNPRAWDYMRPILTENGGFAAFIGTPRGKNFFFEQYERVRQMPNEWYCDIKTVLDTQAITLEAIEQERLAGMSEDRIQQEFFCSFDAQTAGLIYDSYITAAEAQGRLTQIEYDPRYPVETAWDLGHKDATAIWFVQRVGNQVRFIDYAEERGKDLPYFINLVRSKPYGYSRHIGPHDTNKFEFGSGNTILEIARQHGFIFTIAPKLDVEDGIEATRALLPRCYWNTTKTLHGLRALRHYHYDNDADEQDDDRKVTLATKPKHDWSSHCCDALRYLAVTPESQGIMSNWAAEMMASQMMGNQSNWATQDPEIAAAMQRVKRKQMYGQQEPQSPCDAFDPLAAYG
ncbi:MAG: hypothetical protein EBZ75_11520 [Oxalobacteraceae bacterium]|nr:hypothetical protein [Oxalobacteraceae bacterium]